MPTVTEFFARIPLFAELDPEDLERVVSAAAVRTYAEGATICQIGEPGRSLFVLSEGTVRVVHPVRDSDHELARLGPGDFFGEMALLNDTPRSATVEVVDAATVLALDREALQGLIVNRPSFALGLLRALSARIRKADEQIGGLMDEALRDPLTGLMNRAAFQDRLKEEVDRLRRYGGRFSIVFIDPDHLEGVNREHGVMIGDLILSWLGRILGEHTRGSDLPFRFAEDRFTVFCPATDAEVVQAVAERLSTLVSEARTPLGDEVAVTISTACVTSPADGEDAATLCRIGTERLLEAKQQRDAERA